MPYPQRSPLHPVFAGSPAHLDLIPGEVSSTLPQQKQKPPYFQPGTCRARACLCFPRDCRALGTSPARCWDTQHWASVPTKEEDGHVSVDTDVRIINVTNAKWFLQQLILHIKRAGATQPQQHLSGRSHTTPALTRNLFSTAEWGNPLFFLLLFMHVNYWLRKQF